MTPASVLTTWLGHTDPTTPASVPISRWWRADADLDAQLAAEFGPLLAEVTGSQAPLTGWTDTPEDTLAHIILCDQFSRNIHRGTRRAFATDAVARNLARTLWLHPAVSTWHVHARTFALMPFEHSEDAIDQHKSVSAFASLVVVVPPDQRVHARQYSDFAVRHKRIIDRFGRYPHRNTVLGRAPTDEEAAWLDGGGDRFGQ